MALYTRHQLVLLLVVVVTVGFGLAVGHWRRAYPEFAERLERVDRTPAPDAAETPGGVERESRPRSPESRRSDGRPAIRPAGVSPRPDTPGSPIDINRATADELTRLPGIGPVLASRIIEARESAGPFASVDDLRRVAGVGRAKLERFRSLVTTSP